MTTRYTDEAIVAGIVAALKISMAAGAGGDLLQMWGNTGANVLSVNYQGGLNVHPDGVGTGVGVDAAVGVQTRGTGSLGVVTKALAGQTGDLAQWLSSAGAVMAKVDAKGVITGANDFVSAAKWGVD